MKTKLAIAVLLAAATLGTSAYAHGGDHDRGWDEHRDRGRDHWQHQRHEDWRYEHRHDHWRHDDRRPPYAYGYGYPPPPPRYYEEPVVRIPVPPLPPPPHEVLRDLLRGHR
jgi:hypothetical protein